MEGDNPSLQRDLTFNGPWLLAVAVVIGVNTPARVFGQERSDQRRSEATTADPFALEQPLLIRPKPRMRQTQPISLAADFENATTPSAETTASQDPIGAMADLHTRAHPDLGTTATPPERQPTVDEALDTRGSVTFRKTQLSEVVFLLSDLWNVNIVAGENVSGEVSGSFRDAPLREVLTAALSAAGYGYLRTGSSLVVLPRDQLGADDPNFAAETLMIPPSLAKDSATIEAANLLLSERGQLRPIGNSSLLVVDTPQRIERVRQLFSDLMPSAVAKNPRPLDSESIDPDDATKPASAAYSQYGIAYFSPQYTEAELMRESLELALGQNVVVAVYSEENRIMVKGSPEDLRLAAEAIQQLDLPRAQVRITATIYDVAIKEAERLGINWGARAHSRGLALVDLNDDVVTFRNSVLGSTGLITDPTVAGAANFSVKTINNFLNVETLIQALESSNEAKLLANPSITVGNRRQATIKIVQKIPILAADPVDNSGVVFSEVQFEEAGVILDVLPRISRDGTIELQVKPEYSVVTDYIENNPVIDSREAETTVRVQDGQTFALGGLRQKTIVETVRGVPGLRNIKFIGRLFTYHQAEVRESELIVFLKPELVTPCWGGYPRERLAGEVSEMQLDEIAHAEPHSILPCCRDKHCPHHHPWPRANGGSQSLEMLEQDTMLLEQNGVDIQGIEIIQDNHMPGGTIESGATIEIEYPPVIVDSAAAQIQ